MLGSTLVAGGAEQSMPHLHNRLELNELRRKLRNSATQAEILLWLHLKQRGCGGYKFRRQHSVGRYILDLYCPKLKLAVELDGSQHFEPAVRANDREREAWLKSFGIIVIRFTNDEVLKNLDGVIDDLTEVVRRRAVIHDHLPPPHS
jgi:very-short-patch-repair endonuclease